MNFNNYKNINTVLTFILLSLSFFVFYTATGNAQSSVSAGNNNAATHTASPQLPDPLSPKAINELVSRMSDEQVRQLLIERLDAVAQNEPEANVEETKSVLTIFYNVVKSNLHNVKEAVTRLPLLWQKQSVSFANFFSKLGEAGILIVLGTLIAGLVVGWVAEFLVNRAIKSRLKEILTPPENQRSDAPLGETLRFLSWRLINDLTGIIVFFITARIILTSFLPETLSPYGLLVLSYLVMVPRTASALCKFVLSPIRSDRRLVQTTDLCAKFLYRHLIILFTLVGFTIFAVDFNLLNDVPMGQTRLGFWLNLAIHLYIVFIAWKGWDGLVSIMRGNVEGITPTEYKIAGWYPVYAVIVSVVTWILVDTIASFGHANILASGAHYKMMFLLLVSPALDPAIRGMVRHLVPPMKGEGAIAEAAYQSTKRSYIRIGRVLVFAMVIMMITSFWGIQLHHIAAAGVGAKLASNAVILLYILSVGYLVWEIVSLLINRKLASELTSGSDDEEIGGEGGGGGASRLSTVLPIIKFITQTAIILLTILIALGNIGIDVTPLLAGAGILGLAIGFGAQTLVKDVVSGIFFLIEDAFRVGEYLVIADTVGTVEKISLRSLQLRHHQGPVHTIPYGEIPKVTNNSRDWVITKLKFTFPFDTDANKIKKIFKQVGKDMLEADYADDIIQTFKSQGVYDVDDVGIVIRGKFMTKPGTQWVIRKDIYNRVQKALDEAGIQFARKEVRVALPGHDDSKELTAVEKEAVAAAAADEAEKPKPA